ncbi:MAG: hypothetical protein Q7S14_00730 [bacterium]|nr:hypothetical protein [bacterium]
MNNKKQELTLGLISDLIDIKLAKLKNELFEAFDNRSKELEQLRQWKQNARRIMDDDVLEKPNLFRKLIELRFEK